MATATAVVMSGLLSADASTPPPKCTNAMNSWCDKVQNCPNTLTSGSTKYALNDTNVLGVESQWRCYDPSTLDANLSHYVTGKNYCTRDTELRACLDACLSGQVCEDTPQGPPLPKPPAPRPLNNLTAVHVFWRTESAVTGEYYPCIRIPSVILAGESKLLAFAECRRTIGDGCFPEGAINAPGDKRDICMKSSENGGSQWSDLRVVAKGCANPTAVWDDAAQQVVLHAVCSSHISQALSQDVGQTWSAMQPIDSNFSRGVGSAAGPGAGLQLSSSNPHAPGRILAIGHHGAYVEDFVWYSDDHGKTYSEASSSLLAMDEAQLVELSNGDVMANMRNNKMHRRGVSISKDGGASWGNISYDDALISPVCQASILRVGDSIFFSNPASTTGRNTGTLRRSDDNGTTWSKSLGVTNNGTAFAYSCLTKVPQSSLVGLLWETECEQCKGASCCTAFTLFPQSLTPVLVLV